MNVFLTGATGYIGTVVAEALQKAGHAVTGLARSEEAERKLSARGVKVQRGDLTDKEAVMAAAKASDAVIHTATTNDANGPKADKAAVEAIIAALSGSNKPFIYTSGVWVVGQTGNQPVDEDASTSSPLAIVAWRPAIEAMALAAAKQGVRSSVLRPGIVYGRGGGIPAMLVGAAKQGKVTYIGSGDQQWPSVHVDDLADLYVKVLTQAPAGRIWHGITAPIRVRTLAEAAAGSGGAGAAVESFPLEEARKAMGPFADALAANQMVSAEKTKASLDWKPSRPSIVDEVLRGSYAKV
ncbi:MAG: hypothetical protein JWP91_3715 [Fibrobacteres bacterium]|nr:hypothetical protein [Fibrobacterota bacterium]